MKFSSLAFLALAVTLFASSAVAQSPDPRDYEVAYFVPSKTTIINTYLRHQTGTTNRNYTVDSLALRATYILKYGDLVVTPFDMILPVIDFRLYTPLASTLGAVNPAFAAIPSDLNLTLHETGVGDITFLPTIGYGLEQNKLERTHTWMALTTYITAPTGNYNPNRILNIGANRWTIQPALVLGQRFWRAVTLEAIANAAFYTDNDEYRVRVPALAGQNLTLKQKMTIGGAVHLAVDLHPVFFLGTSYLMQVNGRRDFMVPTPSGGLAETNETPGNTVHTFRLNLGLRVTPQTQVLAQWNEDVAGTESAVRGRFFGLRLSHVFFTPAAAPAARAPITDPNSAEAKEAASPAAKPEPKDDESEDEEAGDEESEDEEDEE